MRRFYSVSFIFVFLVSQLTYGVSDFPGAEMSLGFKLQDLNLPGDATLTIELQSGKLKKKLHEASIKNDQEFYAHKMKYNFHFEQKQTIKVTLKCGRKTGELEVPVSNIVQNLRAPKTYDLEGSLTESFMMYSDHEDPDSIYVKTDTNTEKKLVELRKKIASTPKEFSKDVQHFQFRASAAKVDKKDFFGKSDPVLRIKSGNREIFKSETIKNTLDPKWNKFELKSTELTASKIEIIVEDWNKSGSADFIGSCKLSSAKVKALSKSKTITCELINPKKQSKRKYKNSGVFTLKNKGSSIKAEKVSNPEYEKAQHEKDEYTKSISKDPKDIALKIKKQPAKVTRSQFAEYMNKGYEVSVAFGVDFTSSNGGHSSHSALHYFTGGEELSNPYMKAIRQVGDIIAPYDFDGSFPAYGYGGYAQGSFPPFFNLNFKTDPHCKGIDGILNQYRKNVRNIRQGDMGTAKRPDGGRFYGDDFYQIIQEVVKTTPKGKTYSVLVLVIDGDYFDNQATIDAIIDAEDKPLSIVIIGVGPNRNFTNCIKFDADDAPLVHSSGRVQKRDIVQFVKFEDHKHDMQALSDEVLFEIPTQFVTYMEQNGHSL